MKIRYFVLSAAVLSSLSVLAQEKFVRPGPEIQMIAGPIAGEEEFHDQLVCARLPQGKPVYAMPELDHDGGSYEYCSRVTPADFSRLSGMYLSAKTPEDQAAFQTEAKESIRRYGDEYAEKIQAYIQLLAKEIDPKAIHILTTDIPQKE